MDKNIKSKVFLSEVLKRMMKIAELSSSRISSFLKFSFGESFSL